MRALRETLGMLSVGPQGLPGARGLWRARPAHGQGLPKSALILHSKLLHGARRTGLRSMLDRDSPFSSIDDFDTEQLVQELIPRVRPADGPILVWFKHDLRTADHPGLLAAVRSAAASGANVIPFFCLDPALYADLALSPNGPAALSAALGYLRSSLRALGSDLVIRLGAVDFTLAAFCNMAGVTQIVTQREVETSWIEALHGLSTRVQQPHHSADTSASTTSSSSSGVGSAATTRISTWSAPIWPSEVFQHNYRAWKRSRGRASPPLPPPSPGQLPPLPAGIDPGILPSAAAVQRLLYGALAQGISQQRSFASTLQTMMSEAAAAPQAAAAGKLVAALAAAAAGGGDPQPSTSTSSSNSGNEDFMQHLLQQYLRANRGAGPAAAGELDFLTEAVLAAETPAAPGGSFPALLGVLVGLGCLSPRQIHSAAMEWERQRWGLGMLPPLGPATPTVKAALAAAELADFHRQLAGPGEKTTSSSSNSLQQQQQQAAVVVAGRSPLLSASASFEEGPAGVVSWGPEGWRREEPRRACWRWRGALTDYCVAEPSEPLPGAPAILLLHGFGAFGEQWRGALGPLARKGYRVFAPTLPGFGRSEKAALQYSADAWRDFIRDFIVRVVGGPVVLAGNSIGGFLSASAAADYPQLIRGLVLINSAGPIDPDFDPVQHAAEPARKPPPSLVPALVTPLLMGYLENSIADQLKWLYPTNPDAADAWLEEEIFRAACDSRSPDVFASVFYLPKPRALNHLVADKWRGPTLVLQGVLDPLNDARARAQQLAKACPNVKLVLLQAGHCPHDEVPHLVNRALLQFIEQQVMTSSSRGGSPGGSNRGGTRGTREGSSRSGSRATSRENSPSSSMEEGVAGGLEGLSEAGGVAVLSKQ